jgi:hypothetical protein
VVSDYCREIEAYLCRKNDGHLIRIAGPSFDVVSNWASMGVPLNVVLSGIDRYFERYYRNGPRRRPVKIDFCEADVLDVYDQWRRAVGLSARPRAGDGDGSTAGPVADPARPRRGLSLPEHLERVLTRLSSLRAAGVLSDGADPLIDAVSAELDGARGKSGGVRGDARRAALDRLNALDEQLVALAVRVSPSSLLDIARREAIDELARYRAAMSEEAFTSAVDRAVAHGLRERLGLPTIALT